MLINGAEYNPKTTHHPEETFRWALWNTFRLGRHLQLSHTHYSGYKIPRAAPYILQETSYKILKYFVSLSIYIFSYVFEAAVQQNYHSPISNTGISSSKFSVQWTHEVKLPFLEKMSSISYESLLPFHHLNVIKRVKWSRVKASFIFTEQNLVYNKWTAFREPWG